jgi:hypothetical protein
MVLPRRPVANLDPPRSQSRPRLETLSTAGPQGLATLATGGAPKVWRPWLRVATLATGGDLGYGWRP